jgi:hypothetical protein
LLDFPVKTDAWIDAPIETASSGLIDLFGFFPNFSSITLSTKGILVLPPTKTTSSTLFVFIT